MPELLLELIALIAETAAGHCCETQDSTQMRVLIDIKSRIS